VAGIDEAGRGPLAGPVSVGISVFAPRYFLGEATLPAGLDTLDDSKKLKAPVRESLYSHITASADFAAAVHVSSKLVDGMGIAPALDFAILRAVWRAVLAGVRPRVVLVDGNYKLAKVRAAFPDIYFESVVRGDSRVFSIAAAAILAKVSRDRRMVQYGRLFPGYGLEQHKGYGTRHHRQRIAEAGPCPIHRRSYSW
jgi:ribonuclease HII